jgi:predicted nucleic acid-binding protein
MWWSSLRPCGYATACTPDALQAACCLQLGEGHALLTGDAAFQRVAGLNVVLLS